MKTPRPTPKRPPPGREVIPNERFLRVPAPFWPYRQREMWPTPKGGSSTGGGFRMTSYSFITGKKV